MRFSEYLAAQRQRIETELHGILPSEATPPEVLHQAMRYSVFAGGKRIRPLLCVEAARVISEEVAGIERAACAVELVHTYSLIHDDLPALDNDDFRRGRLTCHKVFGEAMAILAGDALLTLAFEVLANLPCVDSERRARMMGELAAAAGSCGGMIAGQVADLEGEGKPPEPGRLETIHRAKTGALIRASVRIGGIYAGADGEQLAALSSYGEHVGLAFQIVDDLLDVEATSETLGKTTGKDAARKKITFPAVYGIQRSHELAEAERRAARQALECFGNRAVRLAELADFIVYRRA
ncbi:MAG: polyprenyl synthetase family protein [Bryobacterales bacterium]|nr:polyprenyl synthetase family protein [Bryobacteraceae bacterium]MDW8355750.1 polyprenyl synthetase family protein [Bryobacterales bacterium]